MQTMFAFTKSPTIRLSVHSTVFVVLLLVIWTLFLLNFTVPALDSAISEDQSMQVEQNAYKRLLSDLPHCARLGRAPTFLLVFMGHSGSTALMTSLEQHSETYISGFEPVDHGTYLVGKANETVEQALNYTSLSFANATRLNKTVGFKIRPRHLLAKPEQFALLTAKHNTRIIWSFRSNIFKQALGDYSIKVRGDLSAHEGLKVDENGTAVRNTPEGRVRIHSMDFFHSLLMNRVLGDRQVFKALNSIRPDGCVLPISYESYLRAPELTLARVQRFLGLNVDEMHPALRAKANMDSICDRVENWEEVCETFFGCIEWRWMLDDFENGCSCATLHPSRFDASRKYCAMMFPPKAGNQR